MARTAASPRKAKVRVAVVGGGVIGLSCAWELARRGAEVAVYEQGTALGSGATIRSAGMLAAAFEWAGEDQRPLAALARHAGQLWPDFAARLERDGAGPVEYSSEGAIVVARNAAEISWLDNLASACQARTLPVARLADGELRRLEPGLTDRISGALLLPDDRQVEPPLVLQRLAAALARAGVAIRFGHALPHVVADTEFKTADGRRYDRIVLATGAGETPKFVAPSGAPIPVGLPAIVPVKGQMLALAPVDGAPRHVIHALDVYIAPKARWILVGATSERGRADLEVEPAAIAELKARAVALSGTLARAQQITAWAGVRPGTPDDAPLIGATAIPGVFAALGHYRNGILFSPATAELVADAVIEGKVSPLATAFDPLRFDN